MAWFVDFVGLNSLVSSSIDTSTNTIESGRQENLSGPGNGLGIKVKDITAGINIHRNGPYGYPTWKQIRAGENPVSRYQRKHSDLTYFKVPGEVGDISFTTANGLNVFQPGGFVLNRSDIVSKEEPAVVQKTYPLLFKMAYKPMLENGVPGQIVFGQQKIDLSLYFQYFANKTTDSDHRVPMPHPHSDKLPYYDFIHKYLFGNFETHIYPYENWESLQYTETVWPMARNMFRDEVRTRPTFTTYFNSNRSERNQNFSTSSFGFHHYVHSYKQGTDSGSAIVQSTWPMDARTNFASASGERGTIFSNHPMSPAVGLGAYKLIMHAPHNNALDAYTTGSGLDGAGILQNNYSQLLLNMPTNASFNASFFLRYFDNFLTPAPLYSRRQTLAYTSSLSDPCSMPIPETASVGLVAFGGGMAKWEANVKGYSVPFLDSYDEFANNIRLKAKNYSVVPEYRISNHVDKLSTFPPLNTITRTLEVHGGQENNSNSGNARFFKTYSHSEFMKMFTVLERDHEGFGDFGNLPMNIEDTSQELYQVLTLKCSAVKKFLPYEGFYPQQRTVALAQQFYDTYKNHIDGKSLDTSGDSAFQNLSKGLVMTPLFAPGVLFNTIKSGVACDYPIITETDGTDIGVRDDYGTNEIGSGGVPPEQYFINKDFDKRIPFEALLEPSKHLAGYDIYSNEPHPSGALSASAFWDGQATNNLYTMMADNFLAEVPEFFMQQKNFTQFLSKTSDDPSVGNVQNGKVYGMRIKMYRSMDRPRTRVTSSSGLSYNPPQDVPKPQVHDSDFPWARETLTMYSRTTAFGPPTYGFNGFNASFGLTGSGTKHYEYPAFNGRGIQLQNNNAANFRMCSTNGYNFPFTPPYYHGEAWIDLYYTASATGKKSIQDIVNNLSVNMSRFDGSHLGVKRDTSVNYNRWSTGIGPQAIHNNRINNNAMQLSASISFDTVVRSSRNAAITQGAAIPVGQGNVSVYNNDDVGNRWAIQTKFETPILNFNHIGTGSATLTLPAFATASVSRGMWHQYGKIPERDEGVYLEITDVPSAWQRRHADQSGVVVGSACESLADLVGFRSQPKKLGVLAQSKTVHEAIVAIPFFLEDEKRKYFKLDPGTTFAYVNRTSPGAAMSDSVKEQIDRMRKYVFPPEFDFIYNQDLDPIAMYVFEFSHTFDQQDLADMWQGLMPVTEEVKDARRNGTTPPNRDYEESTEIDIEESVISHKLALGEMLDATRRQQLRTPKYHSLHQNAHPLRWMVFKVKQRAETLYFKKLYSKQSEIKDSTTRRAGGVGQNLPDITVTGIELDEGFISDLHYLTNKGVQYNWPYDFFSIVELAKLDAEVMFTFDNPLIKPKILQTEQAVRPDSEVLEDLADSFRPGNIGPLLGGPEAVAFDLGEATGTFTEPPPPPAPYSTLSTNPFGNYFTNENTSQDDRILLYMMIHQRYWALYNSAYDDLRGTKKRRDRKARESSMRVIKNVFASHDINAAFCTDSVGCPRNWTLDTWRARFASGDAS